MLTSDPNDPSLTHGPDDPAGGPKPQADTYLVLSEQERAQGFVRPVRLAYWHTTCGRITTINRTIAETYATRPTFYSATYCTHCCLHRPVDEFHWCDTDNPERQAPASQPKVGT